MRKWRENEEMDRYLFSTFPHFLFISFLLYPFPISKNVSFFCDIRDKSAVFDILRQNMTIFDIGNG